MKKIFDLHAHLERNPLTKEYRCQELLKDMEENGIGKRVVSTLQGKSISHQNDCVVQFVRQHPDKLIGCAVINPKEDDALEEAKRISAFPEIRMLEFNSLEHGYRPEKLEHVIDPILDHCSQRGLPVKVFTGQGFWTMPDQWAYYARRFPFVTFVILHMGGSDFSYGTIDLCKEVDNLVLELSYETEMQPLRRAFAELDHRRLLYGSNFYHNYTDLSLMKFNPLTLSEETRRLVFYENAEGLLG